MRRSLLAAAAFLWTTVPGSAAEFAPVLRLDVLGGQSYLEAGDSNFGGNIFWSATPAVRLSDRDAFIPTLAGQFRRTYEARETVGGSFLTHTTLDTIVNLKWVHSFTEAIALKPYFGFKNEMLSEVPGESLERGLFNHHKFSGGLEFERLGERLRSLRNTFAFYAVRFYNFETLAAQKFGSEIRAGGAVLDFNAFDYTMAADWLPWERGLLSGSVTASLRAFPDQNVVSSAGTFSDDSRADLAWNGDLGIQHRWRGWSVGALDFEPAAGFHAGFAGLTSNQNHYEASRLKYNQKYYDYHGLAAGPFVRLKAGRLETGLSYDYERKEYTQRLAQDEDGTYRGEETVYTNDHIWSYNLSLALTEFLSLKAQGAARMSSSNTRYERTYRYNFQSKHYFVGFGLRH
ncbi:MAG: hypothetical protein HY924_16480 [Elusimicrobia bacterium]|nr:hypothetical protein [Elusimicrobiota bacterium]